MNTKIFNLSLMIFWLLICVGLLTRELWMPPGLLDRASGPQTPLVIAVTAVLAAWNLMRFWIAHHYGKPVQPSPSTEEYRRKIRNITGEDPRVTDPQFNFDDPPSNGPSAGGRS